MPRTKRNFHATASQTISPPDTLPGTHTIARIVKAAGNHLYAVDLPASCAASGLVAGKCTLLEMPVRFRGYIWVKKGSYVVADLSTLLGEGGQDFKIGGEIVNVVREEKRWRAMAYWPIEFVKTTVGNPPSDSEEEESLMGKMPPSDSDEEV